MATNVYKEFMDSPIASTIISFVILLQTLYLSTMSEPTSLMKLRARQLQRYYHTKPRTTYRHRISAIDLKRAQILQPVYKLEDCSPGELKFPPGWESDSQALVRFLTRPSWLSLPVTEHKTPVNKPGTIESPFEPAVIEPKSTTNSKIVGKTNHLLDPSSSAPSTMVEDMDTYTEYIDDLSNLGCANLDSEEDDTPLSLLHRERINFSRAQLAPSNLPVQGDLPSAIPHQTSHAGVKRPFSMIMEHGQETLVPGTGPGLSPPAQRRRLYDGDDQVDQILPSIVDEPYFSSDLNNEHATPCPSGRHCPSSPSSIQQTHNSEEENQDWDETNEAAHDVVAAQTEKLTKVACDPMIECNPSIGEGCSHPPLPPQSSNPEKPEGRKGIMSFLKSVVTSGFGIKKPTLPPTPNPNPPAIRQNGLSQGEQVPIAKLEGPKEELD